MKTNAVRLLERAGVPFELRAYGVDDDHLNAEEVAAALEMPPEVVFKTLITRGDRAPLCPHPGRDRARSQAAGGGLRE